MRKTLIILFAMCGSSTAMAEDSRLPEMLHLLATSVACKIDINPAATRFLDTLRGRLDDAAIKSAGKTAQAEVEAEIASKGPVTVCWTAWEKLRAAGFI